MADDGEVKIKTTIDNSELDKGLKDTKQKIDNAGKSIGKNTKTTKDFGKSLKDAAVNSNSLTSGLANAAKAGGAYAAAIAGGQKIVLLLQPGQYRIKCVTLIENQHSYLNTKKNWVSNFLYFELKDNSSVAIDILPMTDETGYCGGWEMNSPEILELQ